MKNRTNVCWPPLHRCVSDIAACQRNLPGHEALCPWVTCPNPHCHMQGTGPDVLLHRCETIVSFAAPPAPFPDHEAAMEVLSSTITSLLGKGPAVDVGKLLTVYAHFAKVLARLDTQQKELTEAHRRSNQLEIELGKHAHVPAHLNRLSWGYRLPKWQHLSASNEILPSVTLQMANNGRLKIYPFNPITNLQRSAEQLEQAVAVRYSSAYPGGTYLPEVPHYDEIEDEDEDEDENATYEDEDASDEYHDFVVYEDEVEPKATRQRNEQSKDNSDGFWGAPSSSVATDKHSQDSKANSVDASIITKAVRQRIQAQRKSDTRVVASASETSPRKPYIDLSGDLASEAASALTFCDSSPGNIFAPSDTSAEPIRTTTTLMGPPTSPLKAVIPVKKPYEPATAFVQRLACSTFEVDETFKSGLPAQVNLAKVFNLQKSTLKRKSAGDLFLRRTSEVEELGAVDSLSKKLKAQ